MKVALVGIGKIAVDQHVPAIQASAGRAACHAGKTAGADTGESACASGPGQGGGVTLFATWHSRMAKGVAAAKAWHSGRKVVRGHITWREDVRQWHPGQDWVFEPGTNALSVLTGILPAPLHLTAATLKFPANRDTPIAAQLQFSHGVTAARTRRYTTVGSAGAGWGYSPKSCWNWSGRRPKPK